MKFTTIHSCLASKAQFQDSFKPNTLTLPTIGQTAMHVNQIYVSPFFLAITNFWEWTKEYSFTLYRLLIFKRLWPKNQRGKTLLSNIDRNNNQEKIQILRITFFNKHFHKMDLFSKLKQKNVIIMECCHAGVNEQNRNRAMDFTMLYHHPLWSEVVTVSSSLLVSNYTFFHKHDIITFSNEPLH